MKTNNLKGILLIGMMLTLMSFGFDEAVGWIKAGSKPKSYDMGIDKGAGPDEKNTDQLNPKTQKLQALEH